MRPQHIILAYSGGLDTSAGLHFVKQHFGCEVTAYCADLGQREDWDRLRERAAAAGADEFVLADLKQKFIEDYVFPALKANARYERRYLLGTPLARPAIVEGMVGYARDHCGDALAHGCTQKGNDQVRFELAAQALAPDLATVAPWRIWSMKSREDLLVYCDRHRVPIEHSSDNLLSHDENLVHITTEGGYLEHVENAFRWEDAMWITPPVKAPDRVETVQISYRAGLPVAVDGESLGATALIERLNALGADNGVGLQDIVENRINGIKVRGIFENPALVILQTAHDHLEKLTLGRDVERIRNLIADDYGDAIYRGLWFSEERRCMQALIDESQRFVSGEVWVELFKGTCRAARAASEQSLYSRDLVTLHHGEEIWVEDATGFLNTISMQVKLEARRQARCRIEHQDD
jgi:argininosuccinate synthase